MIENIKQDAAALGVRLALVPICVLEDLKADMAALARDNSLDELQRRIVEKRYVLDAPDPDGRAKSVVVAIWRRQLAKATFFHKDKEVSCLVDDNYIDFADKHRALGELFAAAGFSLDYVHWLPQKLLAVRSGLCEYGRNNLAYSGSWGSFVAIGTYVSDIETEDHVWREAKVMTHCAVCAKCAANCPTKAILPNRFLIDAQACLADINPRDDREIPDWVPKTAHHALFGCYRCQEVCPANRLRGVFTGMDEIFFDENETGIMLTAESFAGLPENIRKKLWHYDVGAKFSCFSRNLRLMLDNS